MLRGGIHGTGFRGRALSRGLVVLLDHFADGPYNRTLGFVSENCGFVGPGVLI